MPDLSTDILEQINSLKNPLLSGEPGLISPHYQGLSTLNIPGMILQAAGCGDGLLASPDLLGPFQELTAKQPKNIILILVDALPYQNFQRWREETRDLIWNRLIESGLYSPLTAICPSTTCSALTSLWTGISAARHGILGYEMWLKEYGITANMIEHKPITYRHPGGSLSLAGFDPENFLDVESITTRLLSAGVEVHAFQHYAIINSGLSRMFMRDAQRHPTSTASDMWISIRELLESPGDNRKYVWAYWDKLDSISHLHGPDSERALAELLTFSAAFEDYFLNQLDPAVRKDTLVLLTADHGQITTDRDAETYQLKNHREFTEMLHLLPSGENRLAYLHIKPGNLEAVRDYIDRSWPGEFLLIETRQAVEAGLFGPGEAHPEIYNRLGDLIAAARGQAYWWWAAKQNPLIGRHGGLSPAEMLVPLLAARL